jgi:glucose/mannose-6-phosphate isomerase
MREHVEKSINYFQHGIEIGKSATLKPSANTINNVVITGLGGSGIGGKIIAQLAANECPVAIVANNTYTLPSFVNKNTLVIACSYSGNTEETLYALKEAQAKGAEIACVTSGGELEKIAKANGYNLITIPGGNPPRAMLAYSLPQLAYLLKHYNLVSAKFITQLENATEFLKSIEADAKTQGEQLAKNLHKKPIMLYADSMLEGVIVRFRQQINENSKLLANHNVYPEMNHNELVGWAGGNNEAVVTFSTPFDHERSTLRMKICEPIIKGKTNNYYSITAKGSNLIESSLYLILLGDWCTVYLADLSQLDATEVNVIDGLKSALSNN